MSPLLVSIWKKKLKKTNCVECKVQAKFCEKSKES